ncbi:MAG: ATP-binding cassette domain-containing protein, partial [bacterium]
MARLELSEVRKTYPNGFEAAKGVSLTVPNGSFCALLGPSGCGKSTLLRMIAGLEGVTSGTIALDGVNVTDVHPKDRDMAMVFQSYALYPHLSVAENIAFPLVMKKVSNEER